MRRNCPPIAAALALALFAAAACGSAVVTAPAATTPRPGETAVAAESGATAPSESGPAGSVATLQPGALTIATLGDSLTEGQGDDSGRDGYPGRLKSLIDPLRPGTRIVNVGHSGWTSTDLINGQNGEPSELSQAIDARPDVALVWIGSNDLWYLYEGGPEPMETSFEQADLATYEANIDRILRELTGHSAVVFIALLDDQSKRPVVAHPNPTEPVFSEMTAADLALMSAHVKAYNEAIRRTAARYGATTVDFFNTTIFTDPATLYGDGNHPNTAGYDRVAQIWFAAVKPLLA
ncbi:MAG: SGNH/GDSL hydrolase family protein [Candidatus Limnocylindrales bacterium]